MPGSLRAARSALLSYFSLPMHAQLSDKKLGESLFFILLLFCFTDHFHCIVCQEFIQALEKCHAGGWTKFLGACNKQKDELNHCLRAEVLPRTLLFTATCVLIRLHSA